MSQNRVVVEAPPSMVFGVLTDPEAYPYWVMGTRAIRGWDNEWPAPGARLHHRSGLGPLGIEDSTEIKASEPNRRLTLEVRIGPLGAGMVDIQLEPVGTGQMTLVTLVETTISGFLHSVPSAVVQPMLHARNALSLRRLARVAKSRQALIEEHPGDVQVGNA